MAEQKEIENSSQEEEFDDSNKCKLNDSNQCHPCLISNKAVTSFKFCSECEENLCEDCVKKHAKRKATSTHQPIPIDEIETEKALLCSPCNDDDKESKAVTYCKDCEEYLCSDCTRSHRNRKATRLHEPIVVEQLKNQTSQSDEMAPLCDPCKDKKIESHSLNYCKSCEEYLCEICTKSHRTRKATVSHNPVPVPLLQQEDAQDEDLDRKLRLPCLIIDRNKSAQSFCEECEELLCAECTNQHRSTKLTKSHILESPICVEFVTRFCDICDLKVQAVRYCTICEEALCQTCAHKHKKRKASKTHSTEPFNCKTLKRVIMCDPCKENDDIKKAETFCNECKENYCEICTRHHRTLKVTKKHALVSPSLGRTVPDSEIYRCDVCGENDLLVQAKYYCNICTQNICDTCKRTHKKQRATTSHDVVEIEEAPKQEVKVCNQCEDKKKAFKYCSSCLNYLCDTCCEVHIRSKFSRTHVLQELAEIEEKKRPNCDSCDTPGAVSFYCEQCDDCFCTACSKQHEKEFKATRNHQLVSFEEGLVLKTAKLDIDENTESRFQDKRHTDVSKIKPDQQTKKDRPGKPRPSDVLADALTLSWDPPSKFGDDDYYQVCYKDLDHEKKWKCFQGEFKTATALLSDLKSNTAFIFRVRVVYENGIGPNSEESDTVFTSDSPASRIVKFAIMIEKGDPSPDTYALPLTEIRQARNERAKIKKFELGAPPLLDGNSKTIMLVGATGTGKSTLVDGIVNYVLGVHWDDPFRFTVIDLKKEEGDRENKKALSQTEWITCYSLNPENDSRLKYQLNIIDTPGFGDASCLKRNKEIVEQIRQLFSEKQPKGLTSIDAVCFILKAPDARLTAVQSHIFQFVMSLFGRDIEENICSLITFSDGNDPPILAALKQSGLPFGKSFTFNNSSLFAKNTNIKTSSLSPMFWDMGLKSFRAFFDHLEQVETQSLQLTKDVLDERARLEAYVETLQPKLDSGLSKVNALKQEIQIIEKYKSLIGENKDFEFEVEEIQQKRKELPRGQHVINCTNCHFTCHDNCTLANDDEKARCSAMDSSGNCKICPDKCHWKRHANTPYIFEYVTVKRKKTYTGMNQKYKEATGKLLSQEQNVEQLREELKDVLDGIEDMMVVINSYNERLKEIALRPNAQSMTEHIDLMIEKEKLEKKDGFLQRINILNDFRKRAEISRSALGADGKKRNRDTKSLMARFGALLSNKTDFVNY